MLCCCSSEDGGEREGERREDVEAEGGPAGTAHQSVPGPDGSPHPAAGSVGASKGQVRTGPRAPAFTRPPLAGVNGQCKAPHQC